MIAKIFTRKYVRSLFVKFVRQPGSIDNISMAVAIGLFVGFAIPIGGQIPIVILLCIFFKLKKLIPLGIVFTFITNPWTAPVLYPFFTYLGAILMGKKLTLKFIDKSLRSLFSNPSLEVLFQMSWEVLVPFLVGSLFLAVISGVIGYFAAYGVLMRYRKKRETILVERFSVVADTKDEL